MSKQLKKIKFNNDHKDRIDGSIIVDVKACKELGEFYVPKILQSDIIFGYIQTITLDPFGFLAMTQQQVSEFQSFSMFLSNISDRLLSSAI